MSSTVNQIDALQSKGIGEGLVPFFLSPETYCVSCETQKLRNDLAENSLWSYAGVRISISNAVGGKEEKMPLSRTIFPATLAHRSHP